MIWKDIEGVLRHALTFAGGALSLNGTMSDGQLDLAVGAIVTLIGVAWSVWQKHRDNVGR